MLKGLLQQEESIEERASLSSRSSAMYLTPACSSSGSGCRLIAITLPQRLSATSLLMSARPWREARQ